MRSILLASAAAIAALPLVGSAALAAPLPTGARIQIIPEGTIITPSSSVPATDPLDTRAHTNIKLFFPGGHAINPAGAKVTGETPASLACVYGVVKVTYKCNNNSVKLVSNGGKKLIAIVDAYDDPDAAADLATYSKQFGLPAPSAANFAVVYATGQQPAQDPTGGWEVEESLDVDMAHAIAPNAKVVLVEAASNAGIDLIAAEKVALRLVEAAGGGEVSNSWAGNEYSKEASEESDFSGHKAVVFASAGDSPGVNIPAALPNVVAVGGTTINRTGKSSGAFKSETTWSSTGGGLSAYISTPTYQSGVTAIVGNQRGIPDIAADANPTSGPIIYDSIPYEGQTLGFVVIGGTSVASPLSAALVNNAGTFNASTEAELTEIYANLGNAQAFRDITAGQCPNASSGAASVGYDLCTGVGAPIGKAGK